MKLLLISDTHGKTGNLRQLLARLKDIGMILHMGDVEGDEDMIRSMAACPAEFVRGNCDVFSREPSEQLLEVQGHKIFMCHGHRHNVKSGLSMLEAAAREKGADIALYGHTHLPDCVWKEDMVIVNPGSLEKPYQEGHKPAYAILEIDGEGQVHVHMNTLWSLR